MTISHWLRGRTLPRLIVSLVVAFGLFTSCFGTSLAVGGVTGSVHGRVLDTASKAPIAGAKVTITSPSGSYTQTTGAGGGFNFLSVPADTYTVSVEKSGFEAQTLQGVTVIGDGTVDLGNVSVQSRLRTIARVTTRAQNGAYQPSQTQDAYTVSGQRVTQALGNSYSTNESTLLQSAPGVIQTFDAGGLNAPGLSVRGSLAVELGYQYDGVPFSAPFFNANASQGFLNNIAGGSGGAIQVVSGAGDATQGNVGGGVINTVASRGTYPGEANVDLEVAGPYYNHTLNFNDSIASANGRISNYFSYSGSRYVPQYAPFGSDATTIGQYYGISNAVHDDLVDNFVLRFGKNGNQSLQVLGRVANLSEYAGYGGLQGLSYLQDNPAFLGSVSGFFPGATTAQQNKYVQGLLTPVSYQPTPGTPVTSPDEIAANPLHFLKFEYTNALSPTLYLSATAYNWGLFQGGSDLTTFPTNGVFGTIYQNIGGTRTGQILSLTKAVSNNQTITLEGKYENAKPFWDAQEQGASLLYLGLAGIPSVFGYTTNNIPTASDWFLPANTTAPVSASNPCLGPGNMAVSNGCYLYSQLQAQGKFTGKLPTIPNFGINYHNTDQQQWGIGFRDQYSPTDRLHLDFGVRVDGEQNIFGPGQFASPGGTPSDVSPDKVGNAFIRPREIEPRAAVSFQLTPNDAIRLSYGRSTLFFFGQTLGTPYNVTGVNPSLYGIPAKDTAANPACGSGTHGPGPGYTANPNNHQNGANGSTPPYFFKCPNYAASVGWLYDQILDAPDLGGFGPPTYNNFDASYSHQFSKGIIRGWASRTTAYARTGYNVEQNVLLLNGPPNPITGQSSASVFSTLANGSEHTFGIEQQFTTPEIPRGRAGGSGYVTFNYINEYLNTPPVAGQSNLPILPGQLLQSNQYFKAGFVPPVSVSAGMTYQFGNGLRITPSILANNGYAFGVGRSSYGYVNGQLYTIPETNYGSNLPYAGPQGPLNAYNASYYVDPQVPGSSQHPNIASSRGYNEPAIAGNGLTPPQFFANLDLEYSLHSGTTVGLQIFNLTNTNYNIPTVNTQYQPVANGVAGPQTGKLAASLPTSGSYQVGAGDEFVPGGANLPFLNNYIAGTTFNVYLRQRI